MGLCKDEQEAWLYSVTVLSASFTVVQQRFTSNRHEVFLAHALVAVLDSKKSFLILLSRFDAMDRLSFPSLHLSCPALSSLSDVTSIPTALWQLVEQSVSTTFSLFSLFQPFRYRGKAD